jgi:hypothetical protein
MCPELSALGLPVLPSAYDLRARMWLLRGSHQTQVSQVLAAAARSDSSTYVDDIAARALLWASTHGGTDVDNLVKAVRLAAQAEQLADFSSALGANSRAPTDTATRAALDTQIHLTRRMVSEHHRSSNSPPPQASELTPPRSNAQSLVAYNHPTHWLQRPTGVLAPNKNRLAGESAQAWSRLTTKFGEPMAERLFDAGVRGGVMSQINLLDAARSDKTLGVRDEAELQGIARSDGKAGALDLTLHDVGHGTAGYGAAVIEEVKGDGFAEFLLTEVFAGEPSLNAEAEASKDASKVRIDLSQPLAEQPSVVRNLSARIHNGARRMSSDEIGWEVKKLLLKTTRTEAFSTTELAHNWTGRSPSENAREMENILEKNGQLAHLGPDARARIRELIYSDKPSSFATTCKDMSPETNPGGFRYMAVYWVENTLIKALKNEAPRSMFPKEEYRSRAADAVAWGLMIERAAPGVLRDSPIGRTLSEAEQTAAVRNLDLRKAYPPVREEVRRALGFGL